MCSELGHIHNCLAFVEADIMLLYSPLQGPQLELCKFIPPLDAVIIPADLLLQFLSPNSFLLGFPFPFRLLLLLIILPDPVLGAGVDLLVVGLPAAIAFIRSLRPGVAEYTGCSPVDNRLTGWPHIWSTLVVRSFNGAMDR